MILIVSLKVLNETLSQHGRERLKDGFWMSRQFLNRTFHIPNLADVYIDDQGVRRVTLAVAQFAVLNQTHEVDCE